MMKFDLHIHSNKSYDSLSRINKIIQYAKKRKLDGISITDHETIGDSELTDMGIANNIWVIRGSEIQTDIGDIIGLFISKQLESRKPMSLLDEIHGQNGIAILAHPFKRKGYCPITILEKIDAIEIVNARWKDLRLASQHSGVKKLLSMVKGRSAGSDSHFPFEVGRAYWETSDLKGEEDLKRSICSGNGEGICNHFSEWLDNVGQAIKLLKDPSIRQFARMVYSSLKHNYVLPRDHNLNE